MVQINYNRDIGPVKLPTDYPKDELVAMAEKTLQEFKAKGIQARVFFKAWCPSCSARCIDSEPNTIHDNFECCECGAVFPFVQGGYHIEIFKT